VAAAVRNHDIFVRIDTGVGRGHHRTCVPPGRAPNSVCRSRTAGVARRAHDAGVRLVGLQAHVGSGVFDVTSWEHTARLLAHAAQALRICA